MPQIMLVYLLNFVLATMSMLLYIWKKQLLCVLVKNMWLSYEANVQIASILFAMEYTLSID